MSNQFNPAQRTEAIALLESMAWGDMDGSVFDVELCFRRLLEATWRTSTGGRPSSRTPPSRRAGTSSPFPTS